MPTSMIATATPQAWHPGSAATQTPPAASPVSSDLLPAIGPRTSFGRDEEIFGEGERAEYIYQVLEGVVRTCRFQGDGRRQIEEFHLAGEYFGLETGADHTSTAEAVGAATVLLIRRSTLADLASRDLTVASRLLDLTMKGLRRTQDHVIMLGRKGACERVSAFLLDFAKRTSAAGSIALPMSRQDIADYLGLTIETVSRTLSQLESDSVIGLPDRRHITVRSAARLEAYCE
ncbi:MAG: helix-turn-helix domain-containing protein [Ignavibacteriales bacterium]